MTLHSRGLTISRLHVYQIASILLAVCPVVLVLSIGRGNQQIIAFPIGIWLAMQLWPKTKAIDSVAGESALAGLTRKYFFLITFIVSLLLVTMALRSRILSSPLVSGDSISARMAEGEALVHEGRIQEALAVFDSVRIPEHMPIQKARKHHNCGVLWVQLGQENQAVKHLLLSLKYDGTNLQAAYLLSTILAKHGHTDKARIMLDMVLQLDPNYKPALKLRKKLRREKPHQLWKTREK